MTQGKVMVAISSPENEDPAFRCFLTRFIQQHACRLSRYCRIESKKKVVPGVAHLVPSASLDFWPFLISTRILHDALFRWELNLFVTSVCCDQRRRKVCFLFVFCFACLVLCVVSRHCCQGQVAHDYDLRHRATIQPALTPETRCPSSLTHPRTLKV